MGANTFAGRGFFIVQARTINKAGEADDSTYEKTRSDIVLADDIIQAIRYVEEQLKKREGILDFEIIGAGLNQSGQEVLIASDVGPEFLGDWD